MRGSVGDVTTRSLRPRGRPCLGRFELTTRSGGPWSQKGNCCNTASESDGDLRGQQFAETSLTNYLSKGPATTPPDPER